MKVKFLRKYGKNEIGTEKIITVDEQEKKYLLSTGTIVILEDDTADDEKDSTQENVDIPKIIVDENKEDTQEVAQDGKKESGDKGKRGKK